MELLQEETVVINRKMNSLLNRLEQSRETTEVKGIALETQFYVNFGTSLANLLSLYPELAEWPEIEKISDAMNADYIMVFDSDGKEISCSQDYVGYDLTSSAYEELHDFARLLNGVPSIVHPVALDSVTGHNCVKLGITIPGTSRDDSHGALIIALHPESLDKAQSMDTLNEKLKYLISEQEVYFTVDDGSEGEIVDSSERSLIGTEIMDYGLPQDSLMNNYKGFAKIDDNQYYVVTKQKDNNVYYLSSSLLKLFEGILSYGVLAAGCFIVLYATLVILLMSRYTESAFKKWISSDQLAELSEEPAPARKAISSSNFPWIQEFRIRWQKKLPEEKTTTVFVWLLCLILVVFFISDLIELSISNNPDLSLFQYIMRGDWIRGLNLLAFAAVFVLISLAFLLLVALNRILALTNLFLGNRGKTICRLIFSLINYIVFLSVIYLSLEYLGFSPGTILAGLGIIGLGITLGAKDIIADVFSGIMLVFEDEFQVGEYIQIGNFKGKVETIGIRATQITDDGNNIKTINNKEIKEVINLSRKHSGCEVEFVLPIETPAQQVRDILEQNLPEIRKNCDLLIGDPVYLGISRTARSTMIITVFAPCLEQDVSHVQRYLNEEVLKILNDVSNSAQS